MPNDREKYVKPEVMQFDFTVDPSVTLAQSCKDFQVANGAARSGCRRAASPQPCNNITPS